MFNFFKKSSPIQAPAVKPEVVSATAERLATRDPMLLSPAEILALIAEAEAFNARKAVK